MNASVRKALMTVAALALALGGVAVTATTSSAIDNGEAYTLPWVSGQLLQVDPASASATPGAQTTLYSSTGLVWHAADATMYGIDYDFSPASLYKVDPDTGHTTVVGSLGLDDPTGLDVQPSTGTLFMVYDQPDDGYSILATVDRSTAAVTDIGPIYYDKSNLRIAAIAFRPDTGELFGVSYDQRFFSIDPGTGEMTLINSEMPEILGMSYDCGDTLYGVSWNGVLYRIDRSSGNAVEVGKFNPGVDDGVENLTFICDVVAPTTTTTTAPSTTTTTTVAAAPAVVTPRFTG